ncbi:MAG: isoprenylcysteine carboxylmethyltransferase family protein [Candidatus Acidiferrales bacterium]
MLGWLAALVLFVQLPIPLYWFVMHPQIDFWRQHRSAGYIAALLAAWGPVTLFLVFNRRELFLPVWPAMWTVVLGFALLVLETSIFWRVKRDLGARRLIGQAELSGGGELARHGIYAHLRHPRYVGSFLSILGACFLAGTRLMWQVAAMWCALTLIAISLEERELRARFGAAYEDYCRRVPRFLPLGTKPPA